MVVDAVFEKVGGGDDAVLVVQTRGVAGFGCLVRLPHLLAICRRDRRCPQQGRQLYELHGAGAIGTVACVCARGIVLSAKGGRSV